MDGFKALAAATIKQAIDDFEKAQKDILKYNKKISEIEQTIIFNPGAAEKLSLKLANYKSLKSRAIKSYNDARVFIKGNWFEDLCDFIGLGPEIVRSKIANMEVYNGKNKDI